MKLPLKLCNFGTVIALAACQAESEVVSPASPTQGDQARLIVERMKKEADALRKLDSLALEGAVGLPASKLTGFQENTRKLALAYASQYQQDLKKLLDFPQGRVNEIFEPLLQVESAASSGGGIYRTMSLHHRMARAGSDYLWWELGLFRRSEQPGSSIIRKPSQHQIMQDYQALRYFTPPDNPRH